MDRQPPAVAASCWRWGRSTRRRSTPTSCASSASRRPAFAHFELRRRVGPMPAPPVVAFGGGAELHRRDAGRAADLPRTAEGRRALALGAVLRYAPVTSATYEPVRALDRSAAVAPRGDRAAQVAPQVPLQQDRPPGRGDQVEVVERRVAVRLDEQPDAGRRQRHAEREQDQRADRPLRLLRETSRRMCRQPSRATLTVTSSSASTAAPVCTQMCSDDGRSPRRLNV